ncbi:MAG: aminopeptidase P family protein [Actinobacteria bacterium]|nr:aminopeptidase P family protein [Actinomycetota bacterium]
MTVASKSEIEGRWRRALSSCADRDLDGLLVVSRGQSSIDSYADVFYLSNHVGNWGFTPDVDGYWTGRSFSALALAPGSDPRLIVDLPDYRTDLVQVEDVRFETDFPGALAAALRDLGLAGGRVGIVGLNVITAKVFAQLVEQAGSTEFVDCDDLIEAMRVVKSPFELERMRAAAEVGDRVVQAVLEAALSPGTTEAQAVAAGVAVGAELGVAFYDTPVASGPYSNYFSHGHRPSWTSRELCTGDLFHLDAYGAVDGYLFDFGRSCVVGGSPDPDQLALLEGGITAVTKGMAAVRPGVEVRAVFEAVHGSLVADGLAPAADTAEMGTASALSFGFPIHGHSLGLGWEAPWISATDSTELVPGMCLAVECMPGVEAVGSTFFEQQLVITDDGAEQISGAPDRYW